MPQRDGDGDRLWILCGSKPMWSIHEVFELLIDPEFLQQQLQERRGPFETLGATGDLHQRGPSGITPPLKRLVQGRRLASLGPAGRYSSEARARVGEPWRLGSHVDLLVYRPVRVRSELVRARGLQGT